MSTTTTMAPSDSLNQGDGQRRQRDRRERKPFVERDIPGFGKIRVPEDLRLLKKPKELEAVENGEEQEFDPVESEAALKEAEAKEAETRRVRAVAEAAIAEKQAERKLATTTRKAKYESLKPLINQRSALISEVKAIASKIDGIKKGQRDARDRVRTLGKELKFKSEEELERKISSYENQIQITTLSVRQEKDWIAKIKALKMQRAAVREFLAAKQAVEDEKTDVSDLLAARKDKQAVLDGLKKELEEGFAEVNAYFDKEKELTTEIDALRATRKKAIEDQRVFWNQKRTLGTVQRRIDAYKKQQAFLRSRLAARKRDERFQQQRDQEAAEAEARKNDPAFLLKPYEAKVDSLKYLLQYVEQSMRHYKIAVASESSSSENKSLGRARREVGAKFQELKKEEEEALPGLKIRKKKGGRRRKNKRQRGGGGAQFLTHTAETQELFNSVKVSIPAITTELSDAQSAIKKLVDQAVAERDAAKQKFEERNAARLKAKAEAEAKKQEEAAAAAAAAAAETEENEQVDGEAGEEAGEDVAEEAGEEATEEAGEGEQE